MKVVNTHWTCQDCACNRPHHCSTQPLKEGILAAKTGWNICSLIIIKGKASMKPTSDLKANTSGNIENAGIGQRSNAKAFLAAFAGVSSKIISLANFFSFVHCLVFFWCKPLFHWEKTRMIIYDSWIEFSTYDSHNQANIFKPKHSKSQIVNLIPNATQWWTFSTICCTWVCFNLQWTSAQ